MRKLYIVPVLVMTTIAGSLSLSGCGKTPDAAEIMHKSMQTMSTLSSVHITETGTVKCDAENKSEKTSVSIQNEVGADVFYAPSFQYHITSDTSVTIGEETNTASYEEYGMTDADTGVTRVYIPDNEGKFSESTTDKSTDVGPWSRWLYQMISERSIEATAEKTTTKDGGRYVIHVPANGNVLQNVVDNYLSDINAAWMFDSGDKLTDMTANMEILIDTQTYLPTDMTITIENADATTMLSTLLDSDNLEKVDTKTYEIHTAFSSYGEATEFIMPDAVRSITEKEADSAADLVLDNVITNTKKEMEKQLHVTEEAEDGETGENAAESSTVWETAEEIEQKKSYTLTDAEQEVSIRRLGNMSYYQADDKTLYGISENNTYDVTYELAFYDTEENYLKDKMDISLLEKDDEFAEVSCSEVQTIVTNGLTVHWVKVSYIFEETDKSVSRFAITTLPSGETIQCEISEVHPVDDFAGLAVEDSVIEDAFTCVKVK